MLQNVNASAIEYSTEQPFPHCVIDGLWDTEILNKISAEFNEFRDWDGEKKFYGSVGKRYCGTLAKVPVNTAALLQFCNSAVFVDFLEKVTGEIGIIPDPYYEGGGMHSTYTPGFLKMHADFNWHKKLQLYRRLNVLIYINEDWNSLWGGDLRLGIKDRGGLNISKTIYPEFNRTVIFTTTDHSYHGHPDPLAAPEGVARNSLALYYYQSNRPKGTAKVKRNGTDYRLLDGSKFKDASLVTRVSRKVRRVFGD